VQPFKLLDLAEQSARAGRRPSHTALRRALSHIYYALFHTLAQACADSMIGGSGADRSRSAWAQVYRSLDHRFAHKACGNALMNQFPQPIQDFASQFRSLQEDRHKADYDPQFVPYRQDVLQKIQDARFAISGFRDCSMKDRRAFAAHVLFKRRE